MKDLTPAGELLHPVGMAVFLENYWEKNFLHLPRSQEGRFDALFSMLDIDRWLMSVRSGMPDSILLAPPEGAESGAERYRPQDSSIDHVYERFSQGYSVVLNYLEDSWPPLVKVVKSLGKEFCAQIGVNAYLTPKGSKTFPVHVDEHDVLVLQICGEKIWKLRELRQLPVMRLTYKKELSYTPEWGNERLEAPLSRELLMQPGDVLYVPRGMPHCAVTKDTTSLHLTISITPLYWFDFMKAAVEQATIHASELRRALPPGFVESSAMAAAMRPTFDDALRSLLDHISFDETLEVVRRNRARLHGFPADGHFAQLNDLQDLALDSVVEKRAEIMCVVEYTKYGFSNIRFGTRHVRGPGRLRNAMEFIRDHQSFKVSKLPGIDDQSKLVLTRRLLREGLLRFAESRSSVGKLELVARSA